jgi:hypothetical protein
MYGTSSERPTLADLSLALASFEVPVSPVSISSINLAVFSADSALEPFKLSRRSIGMKEKSVGSSRLVVTSRAISH